MISLQAQQRHRYQNVVHETSHLPTNPSGIIAWDSEEQIRIIDATRSEAPLFAPLGVCSDTRGFRSNGTLPGLDGT